MRKWLAVGSLVALFVVASVFLTVEGATALYFGWIFFLNRVLGRMTVYWPTVEVGVTAVVLFAVGINGLGRSWQRRRLTEQDTFARPWRWSWSCAIVMGLFLLFASGLAILGVAHQVGWLINSDQPLTGPRLARHSWFQVTAQEESIRNLKWHALGIHNYYSVYKQMPPGGTFSPGGVALHSWETMIIPFEEDWFFQGLDLNRPWNDPVNQKHFKHVLPEFINPGFRVQELKDGEGYGLSHYAVNGWLMAASKSMKFTDIKHELSNTFLIGEVNARFKPWGHPVNWRDPAIGINRSPNGFGGPPGTGGAQFAMADASVRFVSERVSPAVLRALSTPCGGEAIPDDVLEDR